MSGLNRDVVVASVLLFSFFIGALFLCGLVSRITVRIRRRYYRPRWMQTIRKDLMDKLEKQGKTLDNDYLAKVVLTDGRVFDVAHFINDPELHEHDDVVQIINDNNESLSIPANSIVDIQACPYRISNELAKEAFKKGESGMGYFRLHLYLKDGTVLKDFYATRPYLLHLPYPYSTADIVKIEHAGYH